ncbi:accessory Sec system protein Asp2 [Streptococcus suis]|nr:accessory Sec system protein Asp2 [Streptococcus suis]NQP36930.1 accessory Sec system protein Asp2 [Streptococcus suis]
MANKKKLRVLQIGEENWTEKYTIPNRMDWTYTRFEDAQSVLFNEDGKAVKPFNLLLLTDDELPNDSLEGLFRFIPPYSVFFKGSISKQAASYKFMICKRGKKLDMSHPEKFLPILAKTYFSGQIGSSLDMRYVDVAKQFQSSISYKGNTYLTFEEDFGREYTPLLTWQYNVMHEENQPIELWLEFIKDDQIDIKISVYSMLAGGSEIVYTRHFSGKELETPLIIDDGEKNTYLSISLSIKGKGRFHLGPLHQRWSRLGFGQFIAGGQRLVDKNRQEIIAYFSPGDLKPPLNVYFSGYRSAEGFEGFWMMNKMGAPFILIGDPRLEGGAFYLGSDELESKIVEFIRHKLDFLGFSESDLILSGLSMGTFGASYYASMLQPHAVIIGKPLFSLGTIAANGYRNRPKEFGTAFDMMQLHENRVDDEGVSLLNQRFWEKFDRADFSNTLFAIAYMEHDDYDHNAYFDLLEHLHGKDIKVISKGIEGRHNDNSGAINSWFLNQYENILTRDFKRSKK